MSKKEIGKNKIYIILDETGAMHLKDERYFIIGGYIVNDLNYLRSNCKKYEMRLKEQNSNYRLFKKELKGTFLKVKDSTNYISFIKEKVNSFLPISIKIDKTNLLKKIWNENEAYNYFVTWLINYIIKKEILNYKKYTEIILILDNRTMNTRFKNSLETHLNLKFFNFSINFNVFLKDSSNHEEIRLADIICYMLYRINNHPNTPKTNEVIKCLEKRSLNLEEKQSLFPLKK